MQIINVFDYLKDFKKIHIKITEDFFNKLKNQILNKYGIGKFGIMLEINENTFLSEFRKNIYHPFYRILKILQPLEIKKEELYTNILGFYHWGSHDRLPLEIPRELEINEFFVEGFALYLAEGDNGSNAKNRPRKFRFTNSEPLVINYMIKWINKYIPTNDSYVNAIFPIGTKMDFENIQNQINHPNIKFKVESYNKIIKYKLCFDNAIFIDLILALENSVKQICSQDKRLARAYIRGMMVGEGTVYFNKSRYVRIEMRNEKEIRYIHNLFTMLGFDCKPILRSNRHNMWSLYIGAKQLDKFVKEIGFGAHEKRQRTLEKANQKVLRVNQYY